MTGLPQPGYRRVHLTRRLLTPAAVAAVLTIALSTAAAPRRARRHGQPSNAFPCASRRGTRDRSRRRVRRSCGTCVGASGSRPVWSRSAGTPGRTTASAAAAACGGSYPEDRCRPAGWRGPESTGRSARAHAARCTGHCGPPEVFRSGPQWVSAVSVSGCSGRTVHRSRRRRGWRSCSGGLGRRRRAVSSPQRRTGRRPRQERCTEGRSSLRPCLIPSGSWKMSGALLAIVQDGVTALDVAGGVVVAFHEVDRPRHALRAF